MRVLPVLLLALAPALLPAQESDPLKSPQCGAALASLQEARAGGAAAAAVQALRESAARTCLGGGGELPRRPSRVMQAPVAIPPSAFVSPELPPAPPPVLPPQPPLAIQRPPTVTHCDVGGCWADDGQHLRQVGPNLAGPNGRCSQHGGLVYCP